MSEVKLNIRDANRAIHNTIHGSRIDYIVAALSADPETIEELQAALPRFMPDAGPYELLHNWRSGIDEEPYDAGVVYIDLTARVVAMESSYSHPGRTGEVRLGPWTPDRVKYVPYHLADDWEFQYHAEFWEGTANQRRRERLATPRIDTREIIYGKVCEFIVQSLTARSELSTLDKNALYAAISAIHADWLMTPRADLDHQAPRDVLLARNGHIGWDLQDRCDQWSIQDSCPPGLAKESAAYRFGGFGTHEIVLYYNLVRFLIWSAVDRRFDSTASDEAIAAEVRRLEAVRDEWLTTPDVMDLHGRTPISVIERERQRLPEGMTGAEAIIDHDCPTCKMMAEMPGPMFWNLDGCNMDHGFAFSFHQTREEWEAEEREYEEFSRQCDERRAKEADQPNVVWDGSLVNTESLGNSPTLSLMAQSTRLAELIQCLKEAGAVQQTIDSLNHSFDALRDSFDKMVATLDEVEARHPAVSYKCYLFKDRMRDFAEKMNGDEFDSDIPF